VANAEFAIIHDQSNRCGFQTILSRDEVVVRWISDNDNPEEAGEREAIIAKIDAWWRAFESIRDQLPPTPHHEWAEGAEWTMWKLEPEPPGVLNA